MKAREEEDLCLSIFHLHADIAAGTDCATRELVEPFLQGRKYGKGDRPTCVMGAPQLAVLNI